MINLPLPWSSHSRPNFLLIFSNIARLSLLYFLIRATFSSFSYLQSAIPYLNQTPYPFPISSLRPEKIFINFFSLVPKVLTIFVVFLLGKFVAIWLQNYRQLPRANEVEFLLSAASTWKHNYTITLSKLNVFFCLVNDFLQLRRIKFWTIWSKQTKSWQWQKATEWFFFEITILRSP